MFEKVITVSEDNKIVALLIVKVFELDYIEDKILIYSEPYLKQAILSALSTITRKCVNTHHLCETLSMGLNSSDLAKPIKILEPYELESNNTNLSSRNKRMLESMNLTHFERSVYYVGKKNN